MEDTSRYGKVRRATRGEVGTHLAVEDIKAGDALISRDVRGMKQGAMPIEIVMRWENERPQFKCYEDAFMVLERMHKRRAFRAEKWNSIKAFFAMLAFIAVAILLLIALTPPAEAQEVTPQSDHFRQATNMVATVTAYTSSEDETDSTPFENASGTRPARGSVACPRTLAFGTQVVIDGKTYTCDDRMHSKYADRFDVWVESKAEAFEWGRRELAVVIK
jgi:3D (Asp-Asp-Asp) domain-containing protein